MFRGSVAVAAGWLTAAHLRTSAFRRLFRDVYLDARWKVDHGVLAKGAALLLPEGAAITGRSAAWLWGARLDPPQTVEVVSPVPFGPVRGLTIRIGETGEVTRCAGVPVTTPERTAWDLGRWLPLSEAVPWIDALARAHRLTTGGLVTYAKAQRRMPGSRRALHAVQRSDPRAESPPESILRLEFHEAGIMVIPQYWIFHGNHAIARADLALPAERLAIEYDGAWHAGADQLSRDRTRMRDIVAAGWELFPVTSQDMRNIPYLLGSVCQAIARRRRSSATAGDQGVVVVRGQDQATISP